MKMLGAVGRKKKSLVTRDLPHNDEYDINVSQELPQETWKPKWCNTNLWTGTSQRGIGGWAEKKQRHHPSVMSRGRYGMSGQAAKVKPRPELPPQDPGGRFRGTYAQGPSGNDV